MKVFLCISIFILCHSSGITQNISGLFTGTLMNDSTKTTQNYELLLSEYKDKITGYSYTTFVVNDTLYYSIKRVRAKKSKGLLIVEDTKMIANNFPESPAKGVHQINTIPLPQQDSITGLSGTWRTTQTKFYYALSGSVQMKPDQDSAHSQLVSHLAELRLLHPEQKEEVRVNKNNSVIKTASRDLAAAEPLPAPQRKARLLQTVSVNSDSLILTFYDNGVIDGDSISVLFNQRPIISKQLLTAKANKRTIYLNARDSTGTLLLVAENLGSIPPNTGLLMVQDGENKYSINFSTDLQTNAAILFRKKEKW